MKKIGFRCLIMERMECTLFDAIPKCIPLLKSTDKFDIGSIAIKLIHICKAIHSKNHLIIDIKPENLMICQNGLKSSNKKDNISTHMANSIRMIDFGLVMNLGLTEHRPNVGISNVCGTALYASLNVHKYETPSRRDDIEAMLYLIGELVIVCDSIMNNTSSQYKVKQLKDPAYLPWAIGTSDDNVGMIKEKNVSNIKSEYYKRMPNHIATKLMDCWNEVRSYQYTTKPKYDTICQLLTDLLITPAPPTTTNKKVAAAASKNNRDDTVEPRVIIPQKNISQRKISTNTRVTRSSSSTQEVIDHNEEEENDASDTKEPPPKYRRLPIRPYNHQDDPTHHDDDTNNNDDDDTPQDVDMEDVQQEIMDNSLLTDSSFDTNNSFHTAMMMEVDENNKIVEKKRSHTMANASENCCNGNDVHNNNVVFRDVTSKRSTTRRPVSALNTNTATSAIVKQHNTAKVSSSAARTAKKPSTTAVNHSMIVTMGEYGDYMLKENKSVSFTVSSDKTVINKHHVNDNSILLSLLPKDHGIQTNHAQFDLIIGNDDVIMVKITNLLSKNNSTINATGNAGILVNGRVVEPRKSVMAFASSRIQIGSIDMQLIRS